MAKRKVQEEEMAQQERVSRLADKIYALLKKEGVTAEEMHKTLYRVRKIALSHAKL